MTLMKMRKKAFTLIELLVVISIVSLLSSVIFANVSNTRARARDARRQVDMKALSTALQLYYDKFGSYPANLTPGTEVCSNSGANWTTLWTPFITNGFLPAVPQGPGGGTGVYTANYCYYLYAAGSVSGAFLVTSFETLPDSTTGVSPSCRPFAAGTNWCSSSSNKYYCLCHPY